MKLLPPYKANAKSINKIQKKFRKLRSNDMSLKDTGL